MSVSGWGAKAIPIPIDMTQPDGTVLTVMLYGDEHFHYYTTSDGILLTTIDDAFYIAKVNDNGTLSPTPFLAHQQMARGSEEQTAIDKQDKTLFYNNVEKIAKANRARREPLSTSLNYFPHSGSPKAMVILCEFDDVKFTLPDPKKSFDKFFNSTEPLENYGNNENENHASVGMYFKDMSFGAFTPQFEVIGPIAVPYSLTTFGGVNAAHNDEDVKGLVRYAVSTIKDIVDYSDFDYDGDGKVDLVYIVHAGYGQNTGGPATSIWAKTGHFDTSEEGEELNWYSIASELNMKEGYYASPQINGVGVFCHEFSHAMGLPDMYPYTASAKVHNQEMELWDLMDGGEYTKDGYRPTSYTAWEREVMGWMDIDTLSRNEKGIEIIPVNDGGKAYRILNDQDPTEYMMVENIQKTGWNTSLLGHGLMVYHVKWPYDVVSYDNHPNDTAGEPGMAIVPADSLLVSAYLSGSGKEYTKLEYYYHHSGDLFPGTSNVTELRYEMKLPNYTWYTGGPQVNKALTEISEDVETGIITFNFIANTNNSFDLNGDGKVSTADIQVIINEMKKATTEQDITYDLNNDGKISTADIQEIINEMKR
ncbi:MAG: M6 family metalloprotease domain-containing protein [Prevotella sp.]|nr:M6 family metalloprotease domain-containing protein [Prevotella sp.]